MSMSLQSLTAKFQERVQNKTPFHAKAKIVITEVGAIMIDGTSDPITITNNDGDADVTLSMNLDTLTQMQTGKINGMEAFFQGLLTVEGDQSVAMSLGDILDLQ